METGSFNDQQEDFNFVSSKSNRNHPIHRSLNRGLSQSSIPQLLTVKSGMPRYGRGGYLKRGDRFKHQALNMVSNYDQVRKFEDKYNRDQEYVPIQSYKHFKRDTAASLYNSIVASGRQDSQLQESMRHSD